MKKIIKIAALLLSLCLLLALAACSNGGSPATSSSSNLNANTNSAEKTKVGIILLVENGAFVDMKNGIIDGLAAAGYTEDNTIIDYKCASGDTTSLSTICASMDDGSYDAVFTVATPTTQQFVNLESETPCFFCSVSNPLAAGVISDMAKPDKNATGTSNAIPVSDIFDLANTLTPGISKYGFISCASEVNAATTVADAEEYLKSAGVDYVTKTVTDSSEVTTVTEALIAEGCGAIFVPNDSVVQSGISPLVELCRENQIPTYCSSATTVLSGCLATVAIDDHGIGEKTAAMAVEYLNGKAVADIPSIVVGADYVSLNNETMTALGIASVGDSLTVGSTVYAVQMLG